MVKIVRIPAYFEIYDSWLFSLNVFDYFNYSFWVFTFDTRVFIIP